MTDAEILEAAEFVREWFAREDRLSAPRMSDGYAPKEPLDLRQRTDREQCVVLLRQIQAEMKSRIMTIPERAIAMRDEYQRGYNEALNDRRRADERKP